MLPPFDPVLFGVLTAAAEEIGSQPRCPHCHGALNWVSEDDWYCPSCGAEWRDVSDDVC